MKIFESLNMNEQFANPVLTIGNYDGIHIGHRKIIARVREKAREMSGTAMLMTFHPHPLSVLKPDTYTRLIIPLHLKKRLIEECGIEVMLIIPFDEEFKSITPEMFVRDILKNKLGVKAVIIGYDFKFGKGGVGNVKMLTELAQKYGLHVEVMEAVTIDGEKVGSNAIRKLIMNGDVKKAAQFLDRPHMIEGVIVKGENRGKNMGFPTINLDTFNELVPKNGVYMTEVELEGKRMPAVTNIGFNPTFDGKKFLVETHVLNFSGNLYGREVAIYFHERIRDEIKFDGIDKLKERIAKDVAVAREHFKKTGDRL
jgi:riboflavin kinase/FMN adenylyltransferase